MIKEMNIAIIGLGQVGIYLYNELNTKKKDIEKKTGKKIKIVAISAKNKNKNRRFKIDKKFFYSNPLNIYLIIAKSKVFLFMTALVPISQMNYSKNL